MKVKVESEKVGLKLNIQKTKIMAPGPITSWEIDEQTVETVSDFIFWDSKITADGDCSHEIKRCLLLGRKAKIGRASCRERVDTVADFIFWDSKITADGDCSDKIKRCLLLRRNAMINLSSVQSLSRVRLFATP